MIINYLLRFNTFMIELAERILEISESSFGTVMLQIELFLLRDRVLQLLVLSKSDLAAASARCLLIFQFSLVFSCDLIRLFRRFSCREKAFSRVFSFLFDIAHFALHVSEFLFAVLKLALERIDHDDARLVFFARTVALILKRFNVVFELLSPLLNIQLLLADFGILALFDVDLLFEFLVVVRLSLLECSLFFDYQFSSGDFFPRT